MSYRLLFSILVFWMCVCLAQAEDDDAYQVGNKDAAGDLYGVGVRVGFYLQGLAYIVGLLTLTRVDYAAQLVGSVISFNSLIAWCYRINHTTLSLPEAWVVLAVVLSAIIPGSVLSFTSYITTLKKKRHDNSRSSWGSINSVVGGQGTPILLSLLATCGAYVANSWLWIRLSVYGITDDFPTLNTTSKMWAFHTFDFTSATLKALMVTQSVVFDLYGLGCIVCLTGAWICAIRAWFNPDSADDRDTYAQKEIDYRNDVLRSKRASLMSTSILLLCYVFMIMSAEKTIIVAGLTPTKTPDVAQLIALIAGVVSLFTATCAVFRPKAKDEIGVFEFRREHTSQTQVFTASPLPVASETQYPQVPGRDGFMYTPLSYWTQAQHGTQ